MKELPQHETQVSRVIFIRRTRNAPGADEPVGGEERKIVRRLQLSLKEILAEGQARSVKLQEVPGESNLCFCIELRCLGEVPQAFLSVDMGDHLLGRRLGGVGLSA